MAATRIYKIVLIAAIAAVLLTGSVFARRQPQHDPLPELAERCLTLSRSLQSRLYDLADVPAPGGTAAREQTPAEKLEAAIRALGDCHYYAKHMEEGE